MASVLIRTLIIYAFLSFSIKLMGKRQIGELETGELISALLLSEVSSLPIDNPDVPLTSAIFPTLLIISLEVLVSFIKNKSGRLKRTIEGEPAFVIYKGRIKQKVLRDNRISVNELMSELRVLGIGDPAEVEYAILEANGKLSAIKKNESTLSRAVIIDGEVRECVLSSLGYNREWLQKKLKAEGIGASEVFLMTVDDGGNINIIKEEK